VFSGESVYTTAIMSFLDRFLNEQMSGIDYCEFMQTLSQNRPRPRGDYDCSELQGKSNSYLPVFFNLRTALCHF